MDIASVLRLHRERLLRLPDVTGVGIGEESGEQVIVIFVGDKAPERARQGDAGIPEMIDGYRIEIRPRIEVDKH